MYRVCSLGLVATLGLVTAVEAQFRSPQMVAPPRPRFAPPAPRSPATPVVPLIRPGPRPAQVASGTGGRPNPDNRSPLRNRSAGGADRMLTNPGNRGRNGGGAPPVRPRETNAPKGAGRGTRDNGPADLTNRTPGGPRDGDTSRGSAASRPTRATPTHPPGRDDAGAGVANPGNGTARTRTRPGSRDANNGSGSSGRFKGSDARQHPGRGNTGNDSRGNEARPTNAGEASRLKSENEALRNDLERANDRRIRGLFREAILRNELTRSSAGNSAVAAGPATAADAAPAPVYVPVPTPVPVEVLAISSEAPAAAGLAPAKVALPLQTEKVFKVRNETGDELTVYVQRDEGEAPSKVVLRPGERSAVYDQDDSKVSARQVFVWAEGKGGKRWADYQDKALVLVGSPYRAEKAEDFLYTFKE